MLLVVAAIIFGQPLAHVAIKEESYFKLIHVDALEQLAVPPSRMGANYILPGPGRIHGSPAWPLGQVKLIIVFGDPTNFHAEEITFEVINTGGQYPALLGKPDLARLEAKVSLPTLELFMPGPQGTITTMGRLSILPAK